MGLFGNKVERTLAKAKKKEVPMDVRYLDGNLAHPTKVIRVDYDKMVIIGFAETLREDTLSVDCKALGISFDTRVTHKTHDIRGNLLYYCTLPEDFKPAGKRQETWFVYPRGVAALAEEKLEDLMGERDESIKAKKMYVWNITRDGLNLVNAKGHKFEPGHKFETSKLVLLKDELTCGLEVVGEGAKEYGKEKLSILRCKFLGKPEGFDGFIKTCVRVDSM